MTKCCDACGQPLPDANGVQFGPFTNQITCDGKRIHFSRNEMVLFSTLLKSFGRSVGNEAIYNAIWGLRPECDQPEDSKNITVTIYKIRRKIEGTQFEIAVDWGFGYELRRRASESRAA